MDAGTMIGGGVSIKDEATCSNIAGENFKCISLGLHEKK